MSSINLVIVEAKIILMEALLYRPQFQQLAKTYRFFKLKKNS